MNPALEVTLTGQRLWLDNLSRALLRDGVLERRMREDGVSGVTSNPSIFFNALRGSDYYAEDLARLRRDEPDPERRLEGLIVPDIQAACDLLRPLFDKSAGDDGYVSLEVAPRWAHDEATTVNEARRLRALVDRPNLMVKVPGTAAGAAAFETLTREGINVNVTLLFSLRQVERVFQAYLRALAARLDAGEDIRANKAVASLFLSRVDTLVDRQLEELGTPDALGLRGNAAMAMAKQAWRLYQHVFRGEAFTALAARGARPQWLLWASTGTKNPAYSDLIYVEPLIGPETINTLPDKTLDALRDHGRVAHTVEIGMEEAAAHFQRLAALGVDMEQAGETLQVEGVRLFAESYDQLLKLVAG